MPGHVVGVVLHQCRHHVVPVTELGEQRVHDRVDGLGGIPVERDAGRAGRPDEPRDRVVRFLEAPGHRGRGTGLAPVDVLVVRPERGVQGQQLTRRLRARRVVQRHPRAPGKQEMPAHGPDVDRLWRRRPADSPLGSCHDVVLPPVDSSVTAPPFAMHQENPWILRGSRAAENTGTYGHEPDSGACMEGRDIRPGIPGAAGMVVSRAAELSRLDDLLTALAGGEGSALVVRGEAGIGKTTLLETLAVRSGDAVTVIRTCGAETEAELTFSALADLLDPVLGELAALPEPQAAALMGALALGPPAPGDRLAVCVATLGVLRAAAQRRPVLAMVDDLQWVDASSRECIEYAARRAGGRLAVVLAARDPWYPPEHIHLPELQVGPVDGIGAAELLRHRAPDLAPPVAAAIAQAAAGNPLALVELTAALNTGQRTGAVPLDLPLAPGRRLQHAFSGRIGALGEPARRALLIAAAHAGPELPVIAAACLNDGTDVGHLDDAEAFGLVRIGANRVSFTHPLIRGVVYQEAPAAERRVAHAALAAALGGRRPPSLAPGGGRGRNRRGGGGRAGTSRRPRSGASRLRRGLPRPGSRGAPHPGPGDGESPPHRRGPGGRRRGHGGSRARAVRRGGRDSRRRRTPDAGSCAARSC